MQVCESCYHVSATLTPKTLFLHQSGTLAKGIIDSWNYVANVVNGFSYVFQTIPPTINNIIHHTMDHVNSFPIKICAFRVLTEVKIIKNLPEGRVVCRPVVRFLSNKEVGPQERCFAMRLSIANTGFLGGWWCVVVPGLAVVVGWVTSAFVRQCNAAYSLPCCVSKHVRAFAGLSGDAIGARMTRAARHRPE